MCASILLLAAETFQVKVIFYARKVFTFAIKSLTWMETFVALLLYGYE